MFLNIIFGLFVLMIARIAWRIRNEKEGKPMKRKHFNGRFFW